MSFRMQSKLHLKYREKFIKFVSNLKNQSVPFSSFPPNKIALKNSLLKKSLSEVI